MKKVIISFVAISSVALPNVSMAANSSYGSGYAQETLILTIVEWILGIILFIKIWGMTNNVKDMKNDLSELKKEIVKIKNVYRDDGSPKSLSGDAPLNKLKYNALLGNLDYIKRQLMDNFCCEIEKQAFDKAGKIDNSKLNNSIRPYITMLEKQFNKIGLELPTYVKEMETVNDYVNFLSSADFQVNKEA